MATILHETVHLGDNENEGPNIIPTFNVEGDIVEIKEKDTVSNMKYFGMEI